MELNHERNTFIADLLGSIAIIAEIVFVVLVYRKGFLLLGLIATILGAIVAFLVPGSFFLLFIVLKLLGRLSLGWKWLILILIVDAFRTNSVLNAWKA